MKKLFDLLFLLVASPLLLFIGVCFVVAFLFLFAMVVIMAIPAIVAKMLLHKNSIYDGSNIKVNFFSGK